MRSIFSKIFKFAIAAIILSVVACNKTFDDSTNDNIDNIFFKRNPILENVFSNLNSGYANDADLNFVISKYKELDSKEHFSFELYSKFGLPLWDLGIALKNENKLKTIVIPFEKKYNDKSLLLFAYFETENRVVFKLVDDKTVQNKLLPAGHNNANTFTKEALDWLFKTGEKNREKYYNKNFQGANEGEKTISNSTTISWECWYTVTYYENGDIEISNTQCRFTIHFSFSAMVQLEPTFEIGGGGGFVMIGFPFDFDSSNLYNGIGEKPILEYADSAKCTAMNDIWNNYPNNEVISFITADGKIIVTDILPLDGGITRGLYKYFDAFTNSFKYYYTFPVSEGAPSQTYSGMVNNGSYYFIPVVASIHTHTPCRQDGTNGVSHNVGKADKDFALNNSGLRNWVIGCGAIAQFDHINPNFYNIQNGPLSSTCSMIN